MGKVASDESSLCATEAFMVLRLRASVFVDEMTVVSGVPWDILVLDLVITKKTNITHNTC